MFNLSKKYPELLDLAHYPNEMQRNEVLKVIYERDAASVDCPVISQVMPNVNDYDPSQNTLTIGYYPHRGSRTERFITVRRDELDKLFNSQH